MRPQITQKYREFLLRTYDSERHVVLMGGRRSGKTYATFQWLAQVGELLGGCEILVVCAEYAPLQRTMEDFVGAVGVTPHGSLVHGYTATTAGNVRWKFAHFASAEKAQGTKCDYLFVNEAVNVPHEVITALLPAVRRQAYYNFNPTAKGWLNDYMTEANTLRTTWRDNPHLTEEQREIFEEYKRRAESPTASVIDRRAYAVYYLGEFADYGGKIFGGVERCSVEQYRNISAPEFYGLDFGFAATENSDPTVLIGCKIFAGRVYAHQYIYEVGLVRDEDLGAKLLACGIENTTPIYCDYGGLGATRIRALRTAGEGRWQGALAAGFAVQNAIKTEILDGIGVILAYDGITITETSKALEMELEEYRLNERGKLEGADHGIDAMRYAVVTAKRLYGI